MNKTEIPNMQVDKDSCFNYFILVHTIACPWIIVSTFVFVNWIGRDVVFSSVDSVLISLLLGAVAVFLISLLPALFVSSCYGKWQPEDPYPYWQTFLIAWLIYFIEVMIILGIGISFDADLNVLVFAWAVLISMMLSLPTFLTMDVIKKRNEYLARKSALSTAANNTLN